MKRDWSVARIESIDDFYRLGQYFKSFFPVIDPYGSMALFYWKSSSNPHQKGFINSIQDGTTICSTTSLTPKKIWINGTAIIGAEIGDTYTDERYQRQGMFSLLINTTRQEANSIGVDFVYGTPNEQSLPGYKKNANFDVVPGQDLYYVIYPLELGQELIKRRVPPFWAELISAFHSSFARLLLGLKSQVSKDLELVRVKSISEFEEVYEEFWKDTKKKFSFILDRSIQALVWRFFEGPSNYKFVLVYRQKKLVGYMVFRRVLRGSQLREVLADYLFRPGEEVAFEAAVLKYLLQLKGQGVSAMESWVLSGTAYDKAIQNLGFIQRGKVCIIRHMTEKFMDIKITSSWHFTMADSDNI